MTEHLHNAARTLQAILAAKYPEYTIVVRVNEEPEGKPAKGPVIRSAENQEGEAN